MNYINEQMSIHLPDDEAGNIAFHFINAQQINQNKSFDSIMIVKTIKEIISIIEYHFAIKIDRNTLNFSRLITHLQFFLQRLIESEENLSHDEVLFDLIKKEYKVEYECAIRIAKYVTLTLQKKVEVAELIYLTLHINRVITR